MNNISIIFLCVACFFLGCVLSLFAIAIYKIFKIKREDELIKQEQDKAIQILQKHGILVYRYFPIIPKILEEKLPLSEQDKKEIIWASERVSTGRSFILTNSNFEHFGVFVEVKDENQKEQRQVNKKLKLVKWTQYLIISRNE